MARRSRHKAAPSPAPAGARPEAGASPFLELGVTGLDVQGGRIFEEFLPALQGRKAVQIYKEMSSNDPVVGAMLRAIEMLVRQVSWSSEPASPDAADVEVAEFVESCLHDMADTWSDTLGDILSFAPFGWCLREEIYKQRNGPNDDPALASKHDDNRIGWAKLAPRAQETIDEWQFDERGAVRAAIQVAPPDWQRRVIPWNRFLLFRTSAAKGSPEGKSVLRTAYRPWHYKKRLEEIEAIGVERDLAGLPVAHVPARILTAAATDQEKALRQHLEVLVRNIRRDQKEGLIFPSAYDEQGHKLYELQLLSTGGRRQFDTSDIIGRYDTRIAMSVLADFVLLGHEKVGSFALSSSKTNLFAVVLGAWLDMIAEVFNRFAIPRLLALNTFQGQAPKLTHGDIETVDMNELATYVTQLVTAGVFSPTPELERYLLKNAGLPEPDDDAVGGVDPRLVGDPALGDPLDPAAIDPTVDPADPAAAQPGRPGEGASADSVNASALALNGAQVTSLLEVLESVRIGTLPKPAAIALLQVAYAISVENARAIVDPIEVDEGSGDPPPEPPPGGPPPPRGGRFPAAQDPPADPPAD